MDRGRSAPGGLGAAGSLDGAGEGAGGRWEMGLLGICWETRGRQVQQRCVWVFLAAGWRRG